MKWYRKASEEAPPNWEQKGWDAYHAETKARRSLPGDAEWRRFTPNPDKAGGSAFSRGWKKAYEVSHGRGKNPKLFRKPNPWERAALGLPPLPAQAPSPQAKPPMTPEEAEQYRLWDSSQEDDPEDYGQDPWRNSKNR